jgi:3-deoxy-manno-octulosonate cytidylyltransferase (CMP-KDO synthetase)
LNSGELKILGVIPARFASERFPGKPLKLIAGKPLLQWVIEGAKTSKSLSQVIVATDHEEIAKLAKSCGVEVAMTDPALPSGSDRAWAAAKDKDVDVILNIQGDEPLLTGKLLDQLTAPFATENIEMATLGRKITPEDLESRQTAKIVLNKRREAIYFSRYPIPYSRASIDAAASGAVCLKHIGLYAFKKSFLQRFCENGPTPLEQFEGLEQLRALYLGARIRVVEVEHDSWGVDVPEDVQKIEKLLRARGK